MRRQRMSQELPKRFSLPIDIFFGATHFFFSLFSLFAPLSLLCVMSEEKKDPSKEGNHHHHHHHHHQHHPHPPSFTRQLSQSLALTQRHPTKNQCCRKECVVLPVVVLVLVSMLRTSVPEFDLERLPLPENLKINISTPIPRPGEILAEQGLKPKYPVLLLPGIVSTGLEVWEGERCASHLFRKRIWGTMTMAQELLTNMDCWVKHMQLDPVSGLDPEGIRVRGAFGLGAADYLLPGFWIWAKVIQNLADIGYDSNTMNLVGYDWRLAFYNMQQRDLTMFKIKTEIETLRKSMDNNKVVIATHSMGSNVLFYFLKWVESEKGGKGGPSWVNDNVEAIVSVGGSWLGAPKVYAALMSGEMKDTAALGQGSVVMDNYVPKPYRVKVMRSFHSMMAILPKGGEAIWGNLTYAPDDIGWPIDNSNKTYSCLDKNNNNTNNVNINPNINMYNDGEDLTEYCLSKHGSFGKFLRIEREQIVEQKKPEDVTSSDSCDTPEGEEEEKEKEKKKEKEKENRKEEEEKQNALSNFLNTNPLVESKKLEMELGMELLKDVSGDNFMHLYDTLYSERILSNKNKNGNEEGHKEGENSEKKWLERENLEEESTWTNPLSSPLPNAPNLTLYCVYGVRKLTERGYIYEHSRATFLDRWRTNNNNNNNDNIDNANNNHLNNNINTNHHNHGEASGETVKFSLKTWGTSDGQCARHNGVVNSDGDGTVPLVSLGYMCVKGWTDPSLPFNPGNAKIVTKGLIQLFPQEIIDTPGTLKEDGMGLLRGGTKTGDHVDIMGNTQMLYDLLLVAGGRGEEVKEVIHSSIEEIAQRVDLKKGTKE